MPLPMVWNTMLQVARMSITTGLRHDQSRAWPRPSRLGQIRGHDRGFEEAPDRRTPSILAVTNGAADDAVQHVATPFVAGEDAIDDQEGDGTDVIGDDLERDLARSVI